MCSDAQIAIAAIVSVGAERELHRLLIGRRGRSGHS
jgi:hypothetical protein